MHSELVSLTLSYGFCSRDNISSNTFFAFCLKHFTLTHSMTKIAGMKYQIIKMVKNKVKHTKNPDWPEEGKPKQCCPLFLLNAS